MLYQGHLMMIMMMMSMEYCGSLRFPQFALLLLCFMCVTLRHVTGLNFLQNYIFYVGICLHFTD